MENLEKKVDSEVTIAFRNKLVCKKCEILPRPDTEVMRCVSCKNILCGKCCGVKCPLCQHQSKNPKFSTFIKDAELMVFLSGFKTHPCINVKNGCHDEIPATLDRLIEHDQSCVFQKVPCPDCEEVVTFKNLGQHLELVHVNDGISICYDTETNEYTLEPEIFGFYYLQAKVINGQKYYKKDGYAISWDGKLDWYIGNDDYKGKPRGFAYLRKNVQNLHNTTGWGLFHGDDNGEWKDAGKMLRVREISSMSTEDKELNFEGAKEELFDQFFSVNAYNRQFYPQFKEVNNCLYVRTLMFGFQEEAIPFKVSITFFLKNGENFEFKDNVYPITKGKNSILETSIQCHLKKLTEYYDTKTREIKNQPKIDFCLKIFSPKLDEIAKDQYFESGIEDTDEEINEKDSAYGNNEENLRYESGMPSLFEPSLSINVENCAI